MRILFLGDVVAKPGRNAVRKYLPELKAQYSPDMIIINAENAAHGFGITPKIAEELFTYGADVLTGGNHSWDRPEIISYIEYQPYLLRPANNNNLGNNLPGHGSIVYELPDGRRVLVINILCRLFMDFADDPFACLNRLLPPDSYPSSMGLDAIVIDCHGEATSEKRALGCFVDGRASLLVGTHTHVPTYDAHIQPGGTGYQTDCGMCGVYDSVIGLDKNISLKRYLGHIPKSKLIPAEGEGTVSGVLIDTDPNSGLCLNIINIS